MLRRTCVRLSLSTYTGVNYFEDLDLYELGEIADEVKGAMKKNG